MKQPIANFKNFATDHKQSFIVGAWAGAAVLFLIALFFYNNPPFVQYQPADACTLFTPSEAEDLLGDHVSNVETDKPVISGDTATSKCGYGDTTLDQSTRKVAAVAIRSGINDRGVKQNKSEFRTSESNNKATSTPIDSLGDDAYFNSVNGQLNVLDGRKWLIISYGVGSTPQSNTIDDTVTLAHLVLGDRQPNLPQF